MCVYIMLSRYFEPVSERSRNCIRDDADVRIRISVGRASKVYTACVRGVVLWCLTERKGKERK